MSVPDMATNVSAEGMAELELIEHKSHNVENYTLQSSSSYNLM